MMHAFDLSAMIFSHHISFSQLFSRKNNQTNGTKVAADLCAWRDILFRDRAAITSLPRPSGGPTVMDLPQPLASETLPCPPHRPV
jgi:hypothetical protein